VSAQSQPPSMEYKSAICAFPLLPAVCSLRSGLLAGQLDADRRGLGGTSCHRPKMSENVNRVRIISPHRSTARTHTAANTLFGAETRSLAKKQTKRLGVSTPLFPVEALCAVCADPARGEKAEGSEGARVT